MSKGYRCKHFQIMNKRHQNNKKQLRQTSKICYLLNNLNQSTEIKLHNFEIIFTVMSINYITVHGGLNICNVVYFKLKFFS